MRYNEPEGLSESGVHNRLSNCAMAHNTKAPAANDKDKETKTKQKLADHIILAHNTIWQKTTIARRRLAAAH
jgi:hypothetical protein